MTQTGMALGTPNYISPEQAQGATKIDGRSDLYSLGAMFYHMLTGVPPFQGPNTTAVIMKHLNEEAPNLCDANVEVPDGAPQIITRMMAKDPNERYADCGELLADLERIVDARNPSTGSAGAAKASVAPPKEKRTVSERLPPKRGGQGAGEKPAKARQASGGARDRRKSGPNEGVQGAKNTVNEAPAKPWEEAAPDKKPNPPRSNRLPMFLGIGVGAAVLAVVNVDCKLAETFCKWASKQTGKTVRMPNELEWELACRAGAQTAYCSGEKEENLAEVAWYRRNSGNKPHPVGEKKPNAFGLYDMHGNVHELSLGIDGKGPLIRGGSYESWGTECRSNWGQKLPDDQRQKNVGFRVAMEP